MTAVGICARRHTPLIMLIACVTASYFVFHDHYILSTLTLAGIYVVAVLSVVMLAGLSGQMSLGHAAFFGLGAYATGVLSRNGLPVVLSVPAAVAFTACVSALVAAPMVRLRGYYLSLGTLALGLVAASVFSGWREVTMGSSGMADIPRFSLGGISLVTEAQNFWLIWSMAILCLWLITNLWRSRIGAALLAIKGDEAAAAAMGINVQFAKAQIFVLSACVAGFAGALYAHYVTFIAPERFGLLTSLELVLSGLLGGVGTAFGAVIGAVFLVGLPDLLSVFYDYKSIVYGLAFIIIALYMPHGLSGLLVPLGLRIKRSWSAVSEDSSATPEIQNGSL